MIVIGIKTLSAIVLLGAATAAWSQERISLVTAVERVETVVDEQGEQQVVLRSAERVMPGDELRYTITFSNEGDDVIGPGSVVIVNPIPASLAYLPGTAGGSGADVSYSADGGESWGGPGSLAVIGSDGIRRAAEPDGYTHIRWTYRAALEPGQESSVFFRARLR